MATRRQKVFQERHRRIFEAYNEVDDFGRPRYTLDEIREMFDLKSRQGIYYCVDRVDKECGRRREQRGVASATSKDLTSNE